MLCSTHLQVWSVSVVCGSPWAGTCPWPWICSRLGFQVVRWESSSDSEAHHRTDTSTVPGRERRMNVCIRACMGHSLIYQIFRSACCTGHAFGGKGTDDGCLVHGPSFRSTSHHLHCGQDDNSGTASAGDRSEWPPDHACFFLSFFLSAGMSAWRGINQTNCQLLSLSLSLSPMTADRPLAGVVWLARLSSAPCTLPALCCFVHIIVVVVQWRTPYFSRFSTSSIA